jgi:chlorite dismutase
MKAIAGAPLPAASALARVEGDAFIRDPDAAWILDAVRSHERYVRATEQAQLRAISPPLDRAGCTCAALIPIRKSDAWWALAQDERRAIFEERSHHIAIGSRHLPAIARRLYHARDLGGDFDFLTWFEHAPEDRAGFDDLLGALRATEEWRYVAREVEVRLVRAPQLDGR